MKTRNLMAAAVAEVLLAAGAGSCGGDGGDQSALDEEAVQTAVATAGEAAFAKAGVTVEGGLDCAATAKPAGTSDTTDTSAFTVECTGTTDDGKGVTLTGDGTQEGDTERGSFVGKVDDKEVLRTQCLGPSC